MIGFEGEWQKFLLIYLWNDWIFTYLHFSHDGFLEILKIRKLVKPLENCCNSKSFIPTNAFSQIPSNFPGAIPYYSCLPSYAKFFLWDSLVSIWCFVWPAIRNQTNLHLNQSAICFEIYSFFHPETRLNNENQFVIPFYLRNSFIPTRWKKNFLVQSV